MYSINQANSVELSSINQSEIQALGLGLDAFDLCLDSGCCIGIGPCKATSTRFGLAKIQMLNLDHLLFHLNSNGLLIYFINSNNTKKFSGSIVSTGSGYQFR